MNPLQYTSEEMFSSTELIRKSKKVFDTLSKKEIEKAIILRDGKPAFMLLEFCEYEKIMKEYIHLKETSRKVIPKIVQEIPKDEIEEKTTLEELNEKDLQEALEEIEKLNLEAKKEENKEKEQLKDFWE